MLQASNICGLRTKRRPKAQQHIIQWVIYEYGTLDRRNEPTNPPAARLAKSVALGSRYYATRCTWPMSPNLQPHINTLR